MKALNFISTLDHGRGGHYYDLITITQELGKSIEVITVNIGINESEALNESNINLININYKGYNFIKVIIKLRNIIKKNNVSLINCYDIESYSFACILSLLFKLKVIYTKCGGANPIGYYPKFSNLIVMSEENFSFFKKEKKYSSTNIALFPNRVGVLEKDDVRIRNILNKVPKNSKIFLRISRITNYYTTTLKQTINLFNYLSKKNEDLFLIIIGVVQDKSLLEELKEMVLINNRVLFLNDDYYTLNASELISISDVVVGTGRGIMEAAYFNKILLTPIDGFKYPVLIEEQVFLQLFSTNFSPRNKLYNYNENNNLVNIENVLLDPNKAEKNKRFIAEIFKKSFDIQTINQDYIKFYNKSNFQKHSCYDLLRLFLSTFKKFVSLC